ncbi:MULTISPECIES: hypothetical protein [Aeromonas]|uniref:hypothetical protein n=1 Tax=Aeromonas TaxID=642 RepID=UPI00224E1143|nr:hypothetical protein [Aeromonas veronii]MCX4045665.1 hypothetical protein [Aeromonas veronii]
MAYMVLLRLPSESELNEHGGLEAHAFLDAFVECSVSPFVAHVKYNNGRIELGGWYLSDGNSDWFKIVK